MKKLFSSFLGAIVLTVFLCPLFMDTSFGFVEAPKGCHGGMVMETQEKNTFCEHAEITSESWSGNAFDIQIEAGVIPVISYFPELKKDYKTFLQTKTTHVNAPPFWLEYKKGIVLRI